MVWLIVALGLLAAFGPIMWLMPSKRDRQLAKLREEARRAGLVVELVRVPVLDAAPEDRVSAGGVRRETGRPCTAYRLPIHGVDDAAPAWFLVRDATANAPVPGWTWHPDVAASRLAPVADPYWARVADVARGLEGRCVALEGNPAATSWYWLENAGANAPADIVADIARRLRAIAELQRETVTGH